MTLIFSCQILSFGPKTSCKYCASFCAYSHFVFKCGFCILPLVNLRIACIHEYRVHVISRAEKPFWKHVYSSVRNSDGQACIQFYLKTIHLKFHELLYQKVSFVIYEG